MFNKILDWVAETKVGYFVGLMIISLILDSIIIFVYPKLFLGIIAGNFLTSVMLTIFFNDSDKWI